MALDPDGFTIWNPSGDTNQIYVSSSLGNDTFPGTEAQPVQTIAEAMSRMRNGFPDWIRLRRGDVWTEERFIFQDGMGGRFVTEPEPWLITTYGPDTDPRPRLDISSNGIELQSSSGFEAYVDYVAFSGLHFYAHTHDYTNPPVTGETDGVRWLGGGDWLHIEDCHFEFFLVGIVLDAFPNDITPPPTNRTIRRCVVNNCWGDTGTTRHGIFLSGQQTVLIEENVLFHNGWAASRDDPDTGAASTRHNIYIQKDCTDVIFRGNISADASSHGHHFRPNGTSEQNLFVRCPIVQIGYNASFLPTTPDVTINVFQDNVVLEGNDIFSTAIRGYISMFGTQCTFRRNLVLHDISASPSNTAGIRMEGETQFPVTLDLQDSTFFDWDEGGPVQWTGPTNNTIAINENNEFYNYSPITGTNRDAATLNWVDSNRTLDTYSASIGGAGTYDDFMQEAILQRKGFWRPQYTAQAANDYFRAGMTEVGAMSRNERASALNFLPNYIPPEPDAAIDIQDRWHVSWVYRNLAPAIAEATLAFTEGASGNVLVSEFASGTNAFLEGSDGDITSFQVASATLDFTEDSDGQVIVLGTQVAEGTNAFAEGSDGDVQLYETAEASLSFTENSDGDIVSADIAVAAGTNSFTEDSGGDILAIWFASGTGDFSENADGEVAVLTIQIAAGTGGFTESSGGDITETGVEVATGVGAFTEDSDGDIASITVAIAAGVGVFSDAADGTVFVESLAAGVGGFTESAMGNVLTTITSVPDDRAWEVPFEDRFWVVGPMEL